MFPTSDSTLWYTQARLGPLRIRVQERTYSLTAGSQRPNHQVALHHLVLQAALSQTATTQALRRLMMALTQDKTLRVAPVFVVAKRARAMLACGALELTVTADMFCRPVPVPPAALAMDPPSIPVEVPLKLPTAVSVYHTPGIPLAVTLVLRSEADAPVTVRTGSDIQWVNLMGSQATVSLAGLAQAVRDKTLHLWQIGYPIL
jgi:hypothetical protein